MDYRMLVIEDDVVERQAYRRNLLSAGLKVELLEAHDGRSGLALAEREVVDCILLDYRLPDMDGLELLMDLLGGSLHDRPPVIVVTGEGDERVAAQAIKLGARDYLSKRDLTPAALSRAVRHAVEIGTQERRRFQAEHALHAEKERAQVTLRSIGEGVISTDAEGRIEFLNPAAEAFTGWTLAEARGRALGQVFRVLDESTGEPSSSAFDQCRDSGETVRSQDDVNLVSRGNRHYAIQQSIAPIRGLSEQVLGYVVVFSDMTEARQLAKRLSFQATHDSLTGLVNRLEFEQRLDSLLAAGAELGAEHAVCFLDLDHFKVVNDTCGHLAGDELLRRVAETLRSRVRRHDTVARLGGDEFGILMEHCSLREATRVARVLRAAVAELRFGWGPRVFRVGASIGVTAVTAGSASRSAVLRAADSACYAAKEAGRDRVRIYDGADSAMLRRHGDMEWLSRLQHALQADRFQFWSQPIRPLLAGSAEAGQGAQFELLLRMQDEDGALVSPTVFLPAAERYGMATAIDRWVVTNALGWLRDHPALLQDLFLCNINLSGRSLTDEDFLAHTLRALSHTRVPANKLCFEITETSAIANLAAATDFISRLHAQGCSFALDDFGSGLSSFGYLRNLPVDFVKIDGSLVCSMLADPTNSAMVTSITQIGRAMGKRIVAEWVEDAPTLQHLASLGVHYGQGNGIAQARALEAPVH